MRLKVDQLGFVLVMPDGTRRRASCELVLARLQSHPALTPKARLATAQIEAIATQLRGGELPPGEAGLRLLKWLGSELELVVSAVAVKETEPSPHLPPPPDDAPSAIRPSPQPDELARSLSPSAIIRTANRLWRMHSDATTDASSLSEGDLSCVEHEECFPDPQRPHRHHGMRLFTDHDGFVLHMPDGRRRHASCAAVLDHMEAHPSGTPPPEVREIAALLREGRLEPNMAAVQLLKAVGPQIKLVVGAVAVEGPKSETV
ncbi:hypothetical protein AB1Y20_003585 [Prymnesium parvum]|uniref:DUF222 domain-containing protein n=1 Tax=Prymnesium parvum TaxID=97485 RepID=A0AB34J7I8_PRYPA